MKEINLINISKKYRNTLALDNVSITIKSNDILGIIGSNGSGKSTLLGSILNLITLTSGKIEYNFTPTFSAILSKPLFLDYLSASDIIKLSLLESNLPMIDIEDWLTKYGLGKLGTKKAKKFSTGMKQRLSLAISMLQNADIFAFDEPINGFDLESKELFLNNINLIKDENKIILIAGHDFTFMEKIANKFLLLNHGKVVFYGSIEEVKSKFINIENLYNLKNEIK